MVKKPKNKFKMKSKTFGKVSLTVKKKGYLFVSDAPTMLINLWSYPGDLLKDRGRVLHRLKPMSEAHVLKISDCGKRYYVGTEKGKGWVHEDLFVETWPNNDNEEENTTC